MYVFGAILEEIWVCLRRRAYPCVFGTIVELEVRWGFVNIVVVYQPFGNARLGLGFLL